MTVPSIVTAGASGVAIGGWTPSAMTTGANCVVLGPSGFAATANATTGQIQLLTGADPNWTMVQSASGTPHPFNLAWSTNGTQLLATDTTDGRVQVYNLTAGLLVSGATLTIAGAALIGMTPTTGQALVTQPSANQVSVLSSASNAWSITGTVTGLTNPMVSGSYRTRKRSSAARAASHSCIGRTTSGRSNRWFPGSRSRLPAWT